jgi:DNA (cytosine-5)-methyltransferase 3A
VKVLSLFDGISCGQVALKRCGIKVDEYYASEIDKYAIQVTQKNFPGTIQLGPVELINKERLPKIDLLIGGSPCQGFSFAGKQLNFEDPRSKLFFEFVRLKKELKPKYFFLENVKMKKEYQDVISELLGVEPVEVNSNLVSAQNRKRLYWTNIKFFMPEDKGIVLKDILEDLSDCEIGIKVREKSKCIRVGGKNSPFGSKQEWDSPFQRVSKKGKVKSNIEKSGCLTGGVHSGGNHSDMDIIHSPGFTRRYSVVECEKLQTLPCNYTNGISNSQRYKALGNAWTVDVVCEFFKNL